MTAKKILIPIIALVIIGGLALAWQQTRKSANGENTQNPEDYVEHQMNAEVVEVLSDRIKVRIGKVGPVEEPESGTQVTQYLEYEKWLVPNEQTALLFVENETRIGTNLERFISKIKPGDKLSLISTVDPFAAESFAPYQVEFETDVEEFPFEESTETIVVP